MSYDGLAFVVLLGVAIGTAIYYFFKEEDNPASHQYHSPKSLPPDRGYDTSPSNKRRRNSNTSTNCTICFELLKSTTIRRISCGHTFHDECITKWFQSSLSNTCPNCRAAQL